MRKHLHWDPVGGAAGDMILAALIDLAGDAALVTSLPKRLKLTGVQIRTGRAVRMGISARTVTVEVTGTPPVRHLRDIRSLLEASDLPEEVRERALGVFERLARAEAKVHRSDVERVHFHEVGADDALIDIVGACLLIRELGIDSQSCGSFPLAHGIVTAAHGQIPLPAPAVLELLTGWPVEWVDGQGERVTPTGAALLTTVAQFGHPPPGVVARAGYGTGVRDFPDRPNLLRAILHHEATDVARANSERIDELVAVIDDATGEELALASEILLGAGALDVYYHPLVMKKGRPGWQLTVLAAPGHSATLTELVLRHTSTAGLRRREVVRHTLGREYVTVDTGMGTVRMKVFTNPMGEVRAAPEYEDCRVIALKTNRSLAAVQEIARAAYRRLKGE